MLEVKNLTIHFHNSPRNAVDGVSFSIADGDILGLVGESGSGKTMTAMAVSGLLPRKQCEVSGSILLDGSDILNADSDRLSRLQGSEIGVVFQEPMTAMDPLMRVGRQVEESLKLHTELSKDERKARALQAMADVELPEPEKIWNMYPHELSGGMRQRAMIAAAIASGPGLLLLDEPTTALDVTIQAQILTLLQKLNKSYGMSMLFISHNLKVVRKLCPRIIVMQQGHIVEDGPAERVMHAPEHPYTQKLIAAIPTREKRLRGGAGNA